MLTLFNRKEVAAVFSMKEQAEIRDVLRSKGFDYHVRVVSRNRRGKTGSFGINMDTAYEYIIYVHKKDYDQASFCLRERKNNV